MTTALTLIDLVSGEGVVVGTPENMYRPPFAGFILDMVDQVGKRAGFSPILKNISNYVQSWEADVGYAIIAADLTINKVREKTMDFAVPFMKLGNTILMQRPKEVSYIFSFLHPFSFSTWLLLLASYALTSSLLFITSRLDCPSPSLPACLWLPLASLLGQSTDYLPSSTAPRLLITAWWLFILLLVSAYTANMAAFLTVSRLALPISSAEDLVDNRQGIKYGTTAAGTSFAFFKDSTIEPYRKMGAYMMANSDTVLTFDTTEGIERVRRDKDYAFIMESPLARYEVRQDCTLITVGEVFKTSFYAFAFERGQKSQQLRKRVNTALLDMHDTGAQQLLETKWWGESKGCKEHGSREGLGPQQLGGIFVVLGGAAVISLVVAVVQMLANKCMMWQEQSN